MEWCEVMNGSAMPCHAMPCHVVSYFVMSCHHMPCFNILYLRIPYQLSSSEVRKIVKYLGQCWSQQWWKRNLIAVLWKARCLLQFDICTLSRPGVAQQEMRRECSRGRFLMQPVSSIKIVDALSDLFIGWVLQLYSLKCMRKVNLFPRIICVCVLDCMWELNQPNDRHTLCDERHEEHSGENNGQKSFMTPAFGHVVENRVQELPARKAHNG